MPQNTTQPPTAVGYPPTAVGCPPTAVGDPATATDCATDYGYPLTAAPTTRIPVSLAFKTALPSCLPCPGGGVRHPPRQRHQPHGLAARGRPPPEHDPRGQERDQRVLGVAGPQSGQHDNRHRRGIAPRIRHRGPAPGVCPRCQALQKVCLRRGPRGRGASGMGGLVPAITTLDGRSAAVGGCSDGDTSDVGSRRAIDCK